MEPGVKGRIPGLWTGDGRSRNLSWLIVDEALSHVVGKTLSLCVSDSCSPRCTSIEADISDLFVSL